MITLYSFGPYFGLPDGSPFVLKAMFLLKLAGLAYSEDHGGYGKAPKGKLPFIADDGVTIADTTFIRAHIERKYGFDFDAGLDARQKALAWALERLCEDHLYWATIHARWMDDANFAVGPARFFDGAPAPLRPLIRFAVRRGVRRNLRGHGLGRHSKAEIEMLAIRDVEAISALLGEQPYLMGEAPCGADATLAAFITSVLCKTFETPIRTAAEQHGNLVAYSRRMMARCLPEFAPA